MVGILPGVYERMQDLPPSRDRTPDPAPTQPQTGWVSAREGRLRWLAWWKDLPGNARGAIWILTSAFFFTVMTTLIKVAGQRIHIFEILMARQVVMTLIAAPTIIGSFPAALRTPRPDLHVLRVILACIAMLCGFTAVIQLPLADATAISFAKSFFVTIFAILILKETVGFHRWAAVVVGFLGVLVMLNPTGEGAMNIYGLMAVAGAAGAGMVMILIRLMSRTDRPVTILTYQALGVGLLMIVPTWLYWVTPTWQESVILLAIGAFAWVAQMCNIQAFRAGEATSIASLDYTRLLYATIFGVMIFGQWPGLNTFLGAGIIIAASLYTVHREARKNRRLVRDAEGRGYNS